MKKLQAVLFAFSASLAMGDAALAQGVAPIAARDVVGSWTLVITPAERRDLSVTIESADGSQPDFPLTITQSTAGRLACAVRDRPAECRIDDGKLVVVSTSSSGGARMTFTLADRTRGGFSGTARMRIRLLPVGGHIGSVTMTRR